MVGNLGRMALLTKVGAANAIPKKAEKYLAFHSMHSLDMQAFAFWLSPRFNIIILLFPNLFTTTYFSFTFAD
jgi:hypothetical protein